MFILCSGRVIARYFINHLLYAFLMIIMIAGQLVRVFISPNQQLVALSAFAINLEDFRKYFHLN